MLSTRIPEECTVDPSVILEPKVSTRWVRETARSYGGEKADDSILIEIVSRIRQKAVFATLDLDDRHVAWGLGVVERGYVGLYDIVVAPELRGHRPRAPGGDEPDGVGPRRGRAHAPICRCARTTRWRARSTRRSASSRAYRYTHRVMPERAAA